MVAKTHEKRKRFVTKLNPMPEIRLNHQNTVMVVRPHEKELKDF